MRYWLSRTSRKQPPVRDKGLRKHAYAVDVAADGWQALEQLGINDYDLVILRRPAPGINGLEVCGRLRS